MTWRAAVAFTLFCLLGDVYLALGAAPTGPWDNFNYAPSSRTVVPTSVLKLSGQAKSAAHTQDASVSSLETTGSWITFDFGKEVGGLISLSLTTVFPNSSFALAFSESPLFAGPFASDDSAMSAANMSYDGVLFVPTPLTTGLWTQPAARLRGGFRYLTVVSTGSAPLGISNISCEISFAPHVADLRNYAGYFFASLPGFHDTDFLTKLWYAGAYTVQSNTVSVDSGREVPFVPSPGWDNNATLGVAGPIIVDGAKRDRAVWPGDMGIAVPTQFVSTNDLLPTRNALSTMFAAQDPRTGALPESGPPLSQTGSDTYHAWTLIGTYNYYFYSGDEAWLRGVWTNYTKAVLFLENKVTPSGLMDVTGLRDWARLGGGGINAEGNAILYKVLTNSAELATHLSMPDFANAWSANATRLKTAFNEAFWLPKRGLYRDNTTTMLCPQDANSFAVLFDLTQDADQAKTVSRNLRENWNELGPVAPELPDTISPFISGFELQAHFIAGNDDLAMDLMQREWGYMLYTNISVQSTLLEGFTANGSLSYRSSRGYNYDPSYTSHAHGWSTGPTSALTFYVLGLQLTSPTGRTWSVEPHLSGLPEAEGGFTTPLGWFGVKWSTSGGSFLLFVDVPDGTNGVVVLPSGSTGRNAKVNGASASIAQGDRIELGGGQHTIDAKLS